MARDSVALAADLDKPLSETKRGDAGVIVRVGAGPVGGVDAQSSDEARELERRLLEMGFVEGARFKVLHEGLVGRDPLAVRLDDLTVALRRREAGAIRVRLDITGAPQ